jgi:hypothetical protein
LRAVRPIGVTGALYRQISAVHIHQDIQLGILNAPPKISELTATAGQQPRLWRTVFIPSIGHSGKVCRTPTYILASRPIFSISFIRACFMITFYHGAKQYWGRKRSISDSEQ